MKKAYILLVTLFACVSASAQGDALCGALSKIDLLDTQQFLDGLQAGAVAGVVVEFLRHKVLPDITHWNLHANYGLCRDQLTGQAKIALGLILAADLGKKADAIDSKKLGSRLLGVLSGACTACVATKLIAA